MYSSRANDINEHLTEDKAKIFKAEFLSQNGIKIEEDLNLAHLRIGVNTILHLSTNLKNYPVPTLISQSFV